MSLKKNWDTADIANQLHALSRECSNTHNDGFTCFEFKKELYIIKNLVDDAIQRTPDFGDLEQQWLTEQEKKRIVKILKS